MIANKAVHSMPEALVSRPSQAAWGCLPTPGWVPFPTKTPRRHALIDTIGRTDDPCDRPVYKPPDWMQVHYSFSIIFLPQHIEHSTLNLTNITFIRPSPAYSAPKEGYPSDICNLNDYNDKRELEDLPEGAALINVGKDTPKAIQLRIPAVYSDQTW